MACKVTVNRHGYLSVRLYWNGMESWEKTGLKNTAKNRKRVEARAVIITEEMENGTFDYLKRYPDGNKAHLFRPQPLEETKPQETTIGEFFEEWIKTKRPPLVERRSLERDYRQHFNRHILPQFKDVPFSQINFGVLVNFQVYLIEDRKLKPKTARNIIDACFRAMWRDARKRGLVKRGAYTEDPSSELEWPRLTIAPADPFTGEERDKILSYFKTKTAYVDYTFIFTLFWTGMRPSEAIALRWSDIDLRLGKASITKSRHLGAEASPKTRASTRTIKLLPAVVDVLNQLYPLRATEDDYVFIDDQGKTFDAQQWMWRHWNKVLRAIGVRQRKFYNTRHTFISTSLTAGVNIKWLSEHTGTSIRMIEERYGKYILDDGDAPLRALFEGENVTFSVTSEGTSGKPLETLVIPTGLEPVFPA